MSFKKSFFWLWCLALVFVALSVRAEVFHGKQKFYTLKTEHFYLHYPEGIGPIAEEMRQIAEDSFALITKRLEWVPKGRIHVVMSDKSDAANGYASVLPYNHIFIYIVPPAADSELDRYRDYLRLLVAHELTHIVHIDEHYRWVKPLRMLFGQIISPNGGTPRWMREGMAVYEESKLEENFGRNNAAHTDMVLRTAVYENKFPRIDQIDGLTEHFPDGLGPYLFGGKFFDWLAANYGEERMYRFQKEFASSPLPILDFKVRGVYGKSFYKLYDEFKQATSAEAYALREKIKKQGLTSFEDVVREPENSQRSFTSHPNGEGYAYFQTSFDDAAKIVIVKDADTEPIEIKRRLFGQMSFSHDGRSLAFSSLASVERKTSRAEIYVYDLQEKKLKRAVNQGEKNIGLRVVDPDFSPMDGGNRWLVCVRNDQNTDQLYLFDLRENKGYVLTDAAKKTQLASPRYSPDGKRIVVSYKDGQTGWRDIVVYSHTGEFLYKVTDDLSDDYTPVFSPDGEKIYYTSYKTGIANVFSYDPSTRKHQQLTNVLTGVFQPMPHPASGEIFVQRYGSEHSFIQKFAPHSHNPYMTYGPEIWEGEDERDRKILESHYSLMRGGESFLRTQTIAPFAFNPNDNDLPSFLYASGDEQDPEAEAAEKKIKEEERPVENAEEFPSPYKDLLQGKPHTFTHDATNPADAKKYHPLPNVFPPRYISPYISYFEGAVLSALSVGRTDPLSRHIWSAFVNYRTDAAYFGAGTTYVYARYKPLFYVGGIRYAVDWGTINGTRFFEDRNQGYAGSSVAFGKHVFNLAYFYEHRQALTNLNVNLVNMKPYAGLRLKYRLANYERYEDSISQENGYQIRFMVEQTDKFLGANEVNEERNVHGDVRYYFEMPWSDHHVLGLRAVAGWTWGDLEQFGVFSLGGPFGEGTFATYSTRVFPLRGLSGITFGGDQAVLFSAEYRLPLLENINRGVGTWPIFMDKLYVNFFVDSGDIRFRTSIFHPTTSDLFDRFLVSTGTEFNGRFVLGYGLPINGRLGYGIVLLNRDRWGTLTDSITGQNLKYGSVYLQFGTMF